VGPRADLDAVAKREKNSFIAPVGNRTPVIQPVNTLAELSLIPRSTVSSYLYVKKRSK